MAICLADVWVAGAASDAPPPPAREFRGVWVATVANIDWPSARDLGAADQQAELRAIVDKAAAAGLNAIVLQVRPSCDSIYPSEIEPWTEFLTGRSGAPPRPAYDPLAVWIEECHRRGIELHAWFNPFRARHFEAKQPDAPNHISNTRPDLVRSYDRYLWLDPGEGDAQDYAMRVLLDVVGRYDIDAVHIDDYFYPYPKGNEPFPDAPVFERYRAGGGTMGLSDWRRANIDRFVERMYTEIRSAKPNVKVGISPFGIWRPGFPKGVEGMDAYERLAADARRWLGEGWLDYVSPQLYWAVSAPKQPFAPLLDWWIGENTKSRHVWPGLYTSRIDGSAKAWQASEIVEQIGVIRGRGTRSTGSVQFSMKALAANRGGIADALRDGPFAEPALVPETPWLDAEAPPSPADVAVLDAGEAWRVQWSPGPGEPAWRWLVHTRYGSSWRWVSVAPDKSRVEIPKSSNGESLTAVGVAALDRGWNAGPVVVRVRAD